MHTIRGFGIPAIVALIAAVIVVGGVLYFNMKPEAEVMVGKGTDMLEDGEKMMDKGTDMMEKGDTMMKEGEGIMKDDTKKDDAMMSVGSYEPYAAEKIAKAAEGDVVLFFRASWCPTCRAIDADIQAHRNEIPKGVTILDVNYDDSTALKQKYGVTYQHTFVQVDADGNQIAKWQGSPTLAALVANIK